MGGKLTAAPTFVWLWNDPEIGSMLISTPFEPVTIRRPPASTGPEYSISPFFDLTFTNCGSWLIQRTWPLLRERHSSLESSVITNTQSETTQGVSMPAMFTSHRRWP